MNPLFCSHTKYTDSPHVTQKRLERCLADGRVWKRADGALKAGTAVAHTDRPLPLDDLRMQRIPVLKILPLRFKISSVE